MSDAEVTIRRPRPGRTVSIRELCEPLFAFVIALRNATDPGRADDVRNTFERLRRRFQDEARNAQIDPTHVDHALFAIVALIDETVSRTHPALVDDWLARPLQLEVFGDNTAGIHFYDRLHALRGGVRREIRDLLEVFLFCLSLGFRGKLIGADGTEKLQTLRRELSDEILKMAGDSDPALSPDAIPPRLHAVRTMRTQTWAYGAIAGAVVLVAYVVFRVLASGRLDGVRTLLAEAGLR